MNTSFSNFLNESVSKIQFTMSKEDLEDFREEANEKANDLNIDIKVLDTTGLVSSTVFVTLNGDKDNIQEFKNWVKSNY